METSLPSSGGQTANGYNVTLNVTGDSSDAWYGDYTLEIYDNQNGTLLDSITFGADDRGATKDKTVTTTTGKLYIRSSNRSTYTIDSNTPSTGITVNSSSNGAWDTSTQIWCLYNVAANGTVDITIDWGAE